MAINVIYLLLVEVLLQGVQDDGPVLCVLNQASNCELGEDVD